jgi:hypothetical protein
MNYKYPSYCWARLREEMFIVPMPSYTCYNIISLLIVLKSFFVVYGRDSSFFHCDISLSGPVAFIFDPIEPSDQTIRYHALTPISVAKIGV